MKTSFAVFLAAQSLIAASICTPARAAAPSGRYTITGGTVYDTKTKLTWQQTVSSTTYSWYAASGYCSRLGSALPGTGWRVPTLKELQSLVDFTIKVGPYVDQGAFPSTTVGILWSATPGPPNSSFTWFMNGDGTTGNTTPAQPYNVRCVR